MFQFVHLHVHSHYSLLDGLSKIPDLVAYGKEQGATALALTDHGTMAGAVEFYKACKKEGLKPIIGVETYVAHTTYDNKNFAEEQKPYHLILLAKNFTGYKNLLKLVSRSHLEGFYNKPRIDFNLLTQHREGLICLTACLQGELGQLITSNQIERAEKVVQKYQMLFGVDYYLEMQPHDSPEQKKLNATLIQFSKKYNIGLVATNDSHYLRPEDAEAQDVLLCIQTKRLISDTDRLTMRDFDFSLKSAEDMAAAFGEQPDALANTIKIASECDLQLKLGENILPQYPLPPGETAESYLQSLALEGFFHRYGEAPTAKAHQRLEYELEIIKHTGFAGYFLIVSDLVNWAKKNGIAVGPGRGSAAGSIVSFVLGITNLDPLTYDLMFERFLNPDRISMPDIDLDFADLRRDEVIHYAEERYGKDHVAHIITFGTMAARVAVRDVTRVFGLPYIYGDKLAKLIPPLKTTIAQARALIPELKEIDAHDPEGKKVLDMAQKIEGVARHAGQHAAGIIITPEPLENFVPLQTPSASDPTIVSQYALKPVEDLGLLKIDFLGLRNLTIIEHCLKLIYELHQIEIDIDRLALNDKKTFGLLQAGDTTGVFQLESDGMRRYLRELKPTNLEDIIAMVALYRPGPMEYIPDYIAGKHGTRQPTYLHPLLKPILAKTYGVAIYQEQLMEIAQSLAGFSLAEADVLRKAVGKKIAKLLKEQKEKFISGCLGHNIPKEIAESVFAFIEPFAGYGFNRSHAACYAFIAYQTAYLKAHYPCEFYCSLLTAHEGDIERVAFEIGEGKKMGLQILPPDINESVETFAVIRSHQTMKEPGQIRFGLLVIKNVGQNVVKAIVSERIKNGPYKNLEDFLTRAASQAGNKKSLEGLIKAGALDKFCERATLLANVDNLANFGRAFQKNELSPQMNLFGEIAPPALNLLSAEAVPEGQKLAWELEHLGLYVSGHPFLPFAEAAKKIVKPLAELQGQREEFFNQNDDDFISEVTDQPDQWLTLAGVLVAEQNKTTKAGEKMKFMTLEDDTGRIELAIFPRVLSENTEVWQIGAVVGIFGRVNTREGLTKCSVERVALLSEPNMALSLLQQLSKDSSNRRGFFNNLNSAPKIEPPLVLDWPKEILAGADLELLKHLLIAYPGGSILQFKTPSGKIITTPFRVSDTDATKTALLEILS
ncbi:MAG: polymerase III, alpha subunit protein [Parcubacteria group bacterium GW2011_GWA2_44_15]|nr:MAG: polymerase III, alpha subunit protein [Parcubacteria group bacterium GW2011_GWA2_44_15]